MNNDDDLMLTEKLNLNSVTRKIKEHERSISDIRKELNESTRQAIQMKSVNKSVNDKSVEKCSILQRKFFNETKKMTKRVFTQIKEDEGEIVMISRKFEMLNEDIDQINKLLANIEIKLKHCETEVGVGIK